MSPIIYEKIKQDPKMYDILKHNSYYLKELNRNPNFYKRNEQIILNFGQNILFIFFRNYDLCTTFIN